MWGQVYNGIYNSDKTGIIPTRVGTSDLFLKIVYSLRIIPTRVGTSIILEKDTCALWDHPHACGDKNPQKQLCNGTQGSSPRVWGQVLMSLLRQRYVGIIPTRVGTSTSIVPAIMGSEDHPHACGDKLLYRFHHCHKLGSSPRVWGQAILIIIL